MYLSVLRISTVRALAALLLTGGALSAQEYSFRSFGNTEGLSNLAVQQTYQDHIGFIWVSTDNGIFRYDGERFEAFGQAQGLPPNSGVGFGDAPDGSLLVGGEFGLYRLQGDRFERVPVNIKILDVDQGIQADGSGHTFLGTDGGLVELSSQPGQNDLAVKAFPRVRGTSGPSVYGIFVDGATLWYGCGTDLCRMDRGQTTILGQESGLPRSPATTILKDGEGSLWVSVKRDGVFVMPAGQSQFRRPNLSSTVLALINTPALDADGRVLLSTPDGLLIHVRGSWQRVGRAEGLRGAVYAAREDRQHSLWIGMVGRGLVQWRGYGEWESYSSASGLASDVVWDIQPHSDGTIWVGTGGGLLRGEREPSGMKWNRIHGLEGLSVHAQRQAPNGDLWVGTEAHGAALLHHRTGKLQWFGERQGLAARDVYTLRFDRQQRLWAATDAGLFVASAPFSKFARVPETGSSYFWTVALGSDGTIWAGGAGGLYVLADGHWKNFKRSDGLSNQEVLSLGVGPNGSMWVGYELGGGIDRVHLHSGLLSIQKGVQRQGTDGLVYFLESDASGRLWAGTEHGVDVWDGARWSHYDIGDGLIWNDCDLNAFAAQPDGTVWIGTSGGLSRFKPRPRPTAQTPLNVVFTRLVLGHHDVFGQINPSSDDNANALIAGFTALNASRANGVTFRYRLAGAQAAWTETTHRELHFASLAPGTYRLEVEAQDGDGVWSKQTAGFAFKVPTPWYRSWWFLFLCALFPVAASWLLVRLRMDSLKRRETEFRRLKAAHDEIRNLAFFDPLTALPNRRLLFDRLEKSLAKGVKGGKHRALLSIDLDNFRMLNDTRGHATGDLMLQEVARRLSSSIPDAETVARLGGDEFVLILGELSETTENAAAQAEIVAEKALDVLAGPYLLAGQECLSSASIGITVFGDRAESATEVLQQADIAVNQAKAAGRGSVRFFSPDLQAAVSARASLEADLRQAIRSNQFLLYYQPQVERDRLIGAEALIRWRHPSRGILFPDEFIPLAEETGLIVKLGDWVLQAACEQIAEWARKGSNAHITVSVNISARQFHEPDFVQGVMAALRGSGANPRNLKLELTESILLDNVEEVILKMTLLRSFGLGFSLDDFGTGYSSLAYLKRLPFDQLKIDRAFVREILDDATSAAIAQTIIALSRAMGLSVMAEGVETEAQREFLASLGCDLYQGYLFSRPVPLEEFELFPAKLNMSPAEVVEESW